MMPALGSIPEQIMTKSRTRIPKLHSITLNPRGQRLCEYGNARPENLGVWQFRIINIDFKKIAVVVKNKYKYLCKKIAGYEKNID